MSRNGLVPVALSLLALSALACPTRLRENPDGSQNEAGGGTAGRSSGMGTAGVAGHTAVGGMGGAAGTGEGGSAGACSGSCPGPATGNATGSGVCVNGACQIACTGAFPTLCTTTNSCVELTSDAKNCGSCGHDCLGGTCTGGQCQPVELAQFTGNAEILYVGANAVYATTDLGYIGRAAKDGSDLKSPAQPSVTSAAFTGTTLAEDGDRLFFVWVDSVIRLAYCSTSSCDATITPLGGSYTQYFAVDPTDHRIAWIDYSPTQIWTAPTTGTISGAAITSGGLESTWSGSPLFYAAGGLFIVGNSTENTTLGRLPLSGGNFVNATYGNGSLKILGANSTNIYLYDGTSIVFTPLPSGDGGSAHKLVDTSLNPNIDGKFAVDDANAYWVANGLVQTCQLSSCSTTQKTVTTQAGIAVEDVGVDAGAVYWENYSDGTTSSGTAYFSIWKLAK